MIRIGSLFCDCDRPTVTGGDAPPVEWALDGDTGDRERLSADERLVVIDQLESFGVETVRFEEAGGLDQSVVDELIAYAADKDIETTLRLDRRQLDDQRLKALESAGLDRLSVLVPGLSTPREEHTANDAIDAALATLEAGVESDLETELRFPLRGESVQDMEEVYDLAALLSVDRFRLTHVPSELSDDRRRRAIRRLIDVTRDAHERDTHLETVLSGGIDAGYVTEYARGQLEGSEATTVREALRERLGTAPSPPVAKLGPDGAVFPGPFWDRYSLGSVRDRPFGSIWTDETNPLLRRLRHDEAGLPERCRGCAFSDVCDGGSRGRALQAHDDPFEPDPICYVEPEIRVEGAAAGSPAD